MSVEREYKTRLDNTLRNPSAKRIARNSAEVQDSIFNNEHSSSPDEDGVAPGVADQAVVQSPAPVVQNLSIPALPFSVLEHSANPGNTGVSPASPETHQRDARAHWPTPADAMPTESPSAAQDGATEMQHSTLNIEHSTFNEKELAASPVEQVKVQSPRSKAQSLPAAAASVSTFRVPRSAFERPKLNPESTVVPAAIPETHPRAGESFVTRQELSRELNSLRRLMESRK